jgi:hypothetical protein
MNVQDYQNKRKQSPFGQKKSTVEPLSVKDIFDEKKRQQMNESEEEDEDEDDWGEPKQKEIKLHKIDMKNKNLNKLDNEELAAYKRAMDKDFGSKQLKPGDPGFVYDKVVEFQKSSAPLADDSWGEDDEVEEEKEGEEQEEYYYDEEEEQEVQQEVAKIQRASNLDSE